MTAVHLPAPTLERRALLRAGAVGAAVVAAATTLDVAAPQALIGALGDGAGRAVVSTALLSTSEAEAWIGHEVELRTDGVVGTAQVVDVRRPPSTAGTPTWTGEAYSLLVDASWLTAASHHLVTLTHEGRSTTLVMLPVNGDGSWEAVVDRRRFDPTAQGG